MLSFSLVCICFSVWFGLVYLKVKRIKHIQILPLLTYRKETTVWHSITNKDKNTEKSRAYFHSGPLGGNKTREISLSCAVCSLLLRCLDILLY